MGTALSRRCSVVDTALFHAGPRGNTCSDGSVQRLSVSVRLLCGYVRLCAALC